ncbi:MAG: LuxR C-terminal-related transcriptional regulator [Anaerolineaceae bacterium]
MTRLLFLPDDLTVVQVEVEITPRQLVAAINSGLRPLPLLRDAPFPKLIANQLGNTVVVAPAVKRGRPSHLAPLKTRLTRRQRQVLELKSVGLSAAEIAITLGIARRTVSYHLGQLREQLKQDASSLSLDPIGVRKLLEDEG